jgi:hypothetical protein
MTTYEDVSRQRLTLVVDNTAPRMPPRATALERLSYLFALAMAALVGAFLCAAAMFGLGVIS